MTPTHQSALLLARTLLHDAAVDVAAASFSGADLTAALALFRHRLESLTMIESYLAASGAAEVARVYAAIEEREAIPMPEWVQ